MSKKEIIKEAEAYIEKQTKIPSNGRTVRISPTERNRLIKSAFSVVKGLK
jgi:hypothetical protein